MQTIRRLQSPEKLKDLPVLDAMVLLVLPHFLLYAEYDSLPTVGGCLLLRNFTYMTSVIDINLLAKEEIASVIVRQPHLCKKVDIEKFDAREFAMLCSNFSMFLIYCDIESFEEYDLYCLVDAVAHASHLKLREI
jgi:hypothetical protein